MVHVGRSSDRAVVAAAAYARSTIMSRKIIALCLAESNDQHHGPKRHPTQLNLSNLAAASASAISSLKRPSTAEGGLNDPR